MTIETNGPRADDDSLLSVDVLTEPTVRMDVRAVIERVSAAPRVLPFNIARTDFLSDYARRLGRQARSQGEAQSLAFWLRKAELNRLSREFSELRRSDVMLMPRGLTFHIPPANVDTIFVYSLAVALLTGNSGIVRLSSRAVAKPNVVLDVLRDVLRDHRDVAEAVALINYGHDARVNAALSDACDIRVIWGGDATIDSIRQSPLRPHARDITFADRFSLAAIGTKSFLRLTGSERDALVEKFFNDTFWFDQMGCSSPRSVIWIGGQPHGVAAEDFHKRLEAVAERKGYFPEVSVEVAKLNQAYRSVLDMEIESYRRYGVADTVLETKSFPGARGDFCGGGLLYQWRANSLVDLASHVERRDQTLTVFGTGHSACVELVETLAGSGIDRIVPIGHALDFGRFWDGYDLLAEFTRRVTIDVPETDQ